MAPAITRLLQPCELEYRLRHHRVVVVASPCSGHGFKFSNIIGQVCADLALTGETDFDIDFLRLNRFRAAA